MQYSIVDICNLALVQLKVRPIIGLKDGTEEARQCDKMFPFVLSQLLAMSNWSFAKIRRTISRLDVKTLDKSYLPKEKLNYFKYPSDAVRVRSVVLDGRVFEWDKPENDNGYEIMSVKIKAPQEDLFVQVFATKAKHLEIEYTRYIDNPQFWPPLFTEALVRYLAYMLSTVVSGSSGSAETQYQLFQLAYAKASAGNNNERKQTLRPEPKIFRGCW